jgi:asparagine synthase (glutamine-hydrolysing)
MSAIAGIRRWDDRPVRGFELQSMLEAMSERGPVACFCRTNGATGLGHGSSHVGSARAAETFSTPDQMPELAITADARIDNRSELMRALGSLGWARSSTDDADLILAAYEAWGDRCVEHFIGDFAFVIWDSRRRIVFGARDHFGTRPLLYYHDPGHSFVVASETRGLLQAAEVPAALNRARIADFLVPELECVDKTSTFLTRIFRLPPAHTFRVSADGMDSSRYWFPDPSREQHLPSDDDYAEAFLETFTAAVECRLRGATPPASMLSGGLDSSSIVGVASRVLAQTTGQPLQTFSVISRNREQCGETRSIAATEQIARIQPHHIRLDRLAPYIADIDRATRRADELFDVGMILPHAIYACAKRQGVGVLLDGVDGDYVASHEPSSLSNLIHGGQWLPAARQAVAFARFYRGWYRPWSSPWRLLGRSFASALTPDSFRQRRWEQRRPDATKDIWERSIISRELAREVDLPDRMAAVQSGPAKFKSLREHQAHELDRPFVIAALERYDRVAAAHSIEARHPFFDKRLVELCLAIPWQPKVRDGWPKAIVRRSMRGLLPDSVRWRPGRWERLGPALAGRFFESHKNRFRELISTGLGGLQGLVDVAAMRRAHATFERTGDVEAGEKLWQATNLANWLERRRTGAKRHVA